MRPAEAIDPPDGNSTVVSFLRVRKPGIEVLSMDKDFEVSISVTSVAILKLDTPLRQNYRREV